MMKTRMIIVAAPSGAGKSSFVERVVKEISALEDTVTYTTRSMRPGESQGAPYYFISLDDFHNKVKTGFFVEWAKVHSNFYGTSLEQIENAFKAGKTIIMDIDIQGVDTFKKKYPEASTIFILPPSIDELRQRIRKRGGGEPPDMELRMANAVREIERAHEFDFQIVNDVFDESYSQFKKIVEELLAKK
ncbi:MAG: guanylate kinase [Pseudobdellovibrionaceae bacterium]